MLKALQKGEPAGKRGERFLLESHSALNPSIQGHFAVGKQQYPFLGPLCGIKEQTIPLASE